MTMDKINAAYNDIKNKISEKPRVGLILGSGLGDFANQFTDSTYIRYDEISNFPVSTVSGHEGRFVFGKLNGVPVCAMQGRVHYYEGYSIQDVVLPTRLMYRMGAKILFLTNAAGGIDDSFQPADFMMITDHIACFAPNPLIGPNVDELGTRFPDMSEIYDKELQNVIRSAAAEDQIPLREGVYVYLTGPSFESPAEIRMLRTMGASAVGMSTVVEAIAAKHCGMRICGISCICNLAAGMTENPLSHQEVQEAANIAAPKFKKLLTDSVAKMGAV